MKRIFYTLALLAVGCSTTQKVADTPETPNAPKTPTVSVVADPTEFANTITEEELKEMLYTYASDEFEGRNTGDKGQKMAANYIKDFYTKLGIPAALGNGNYFQTVPLQSVSMPSGSITVSGTAYEFGKNVITFSSPKSSTTDYNNVVFAGYGIVDDAYSDYANIDVKGKLVLIKAGEPKKADGTYTITGTKEASKWSNLRAAFSDKMQAAKDNGAIGLLFYDDENFSRLAARFNFLKNNTKADNLSLKDASNEFLFLFVDKTLASAMYKDIETANTAKTLSTKTTIAVESNVKEVNSENVVAVLKGTEKPDEYLVISAHLDHVGMDDKGNVYNGADDDGSGTVSVLQIAEAFKKASDAGKGPKRSIVFLNVTGEEKGLLGSEYYSEHPIFPMAQTVADLNIDMVGRIDPKREGDRNYVYLIGSDKLSTELHTISEASNDKYMHMELDYTYNDDNDPNRFYYRSDHYNFAKHNVPIIFYFNGTHDDYHQITDTPDKINYDLLANRAKLVFYTAWELANRDKRIVADKAVTEE